MTDAPSAGPRPARPWAAVRRHPLRVGLALLLALVLVTSVLGAALLSSRAGSGRLDLIPEAELDRRWGTYLSEREWGNPREAIGGDGWGLSWRGATDTDYRYGDDGIAGVTDRDHEFRVGWAFWDGRAETVTERFYGSTNPQGAAGEDIVDDRVFGENTPNHGFTRMRYRYPAAEPVFDIALESAKYDSSTIVLSAAVTNTAADERTLSVVLKGWMAPAGEVDPIAGGLLLRGEETVVAIVGNAPDEWQITADKGALDTELRNGRLVGDTGGHIGALAYHVTIGGGDTESVRLALAEAPMAESEAASRTAREVLGSAAGVLESRRSEATRLFAGHVADHVPLYRQALMSVLWNESYYRWDGASEVNPTYAGRIDARDVLIVPDKWEYPWIASWDSAFHAVTAALIDPQLGQDQLRFVLSERWQQPDGHIPCAEWVMDAECPPIFAWAAWEVYERNSDRAFLTEVYPRLQLHYDHWWNAYAIDEAFFTGGFLGMDNLPRSGAEPQADASGWMAMFARDMALIASELGDDAAAERYWLDRGRIQEAINAWLWDEETQFYHDVNSAGRPIPHKSYSGLVPLIAGVVPPERIPPMLHALRDPEQFLSVAGIRSVSAQSSIYTPGQAGKGVNSNWRGPVWVPINYLLIAALREVDPGFARELRNRVVLAVERDWQRTGRFHEFFDGDSGAGLGADHQAGWTALVANLIADGWPGPAADEPEE